MIEKLNIQEKHDHPDLEEKLQGIPKEFLLHADEVNEIVGKINEIIPLLVEASTRPSLFAVLFKEQILTVDEQNQVRINIGLVFPKEHENPHQVYLLNKE